MSVTQSHARLVARRGELLAELFLQDLDPVFVARPTPDLPFHYFVGFKNPHDGINLTAVEVKATERPSPEHFALPRRLYDRLANSNIPGLLLVIDVKHNRVSYAWPTPDAARGRTEKTVTLRLTELDENAKRELRERLAS